MRKSRKHSKVKLENKQVEIMEDAQTFQKDVQKVDKAEFSMVTRAANEKFAQRYLDGHDYDLGSITAEIKVHLGHVVYGYIEVGRRLLAVKEVEGHGKFISWLKKHFDLSPRQAQNFMLVADKLAQRPELASLANGGISKALVLLDMPEEYNKEYIKEGTIGGKPLDEYHTMTREELTAEVKRLKGDTDKIVAEETKASKAEIDGLIAENKRLQKFEPVETPTPEWVLEQAKQLNLTALQMCTLCRGFMYDERMKSDFVMQAKVEKQMGLAIKELMDIRLEWSRTFTPPEVD